MIQGNKTFSLSIAFEKAQLPPFNDVLLLGHKSPVGMSGIMKSIEFLVPNNFEVIPFEDQTVEAMVVNKAILKRMPKDKLIAVLKEAVIPYMSENEIMKVDLVVRIHMEGSLENDEAGK